MTQLIKCFTQHIRNNISKETQNIKVFWWQFKQQQSLFAVTVTVQIYLLSNDLLRG